MHSLFAMHEVLPSVTTGAVEVVNAAVVVALAVAVAVSVAECFPNSG